MIDYFFVIFCGKFFFDKNGLKNYFGFFYGCRVDMGVVIFMCGCLVMVGWMMIVIVMDMLLVCGLFLLILLLMMVRWLGMMNFVFLFLFLFLVMVKVFLEMWGW